MDSNADEQRMTGERQSDPEDHAEHPRGKKSAIDIEDRVAGGDERNQANDRPEGRGASAPGGATLVHEGAPVSQVRLPGGGLQGSIEKMPGHPKSARRGIQAFCATVAVAASLACASFEQNPAWNPDASAPASPGATWNPPKGKAGPQSLDEILSLTPASSEAASAPDPPAATTSARLLESLDRQIPPSSEAQPLELAELIGIALSENPRTRQAWRQAQAAAARLGESMGDYYPTLSLEVTAGAEKSGFEFTDSAVIVREVQVEPELQLTYVLLDFGRRTAKAEAARRVLEAANYSFNRELQRVIYEVQAGFYRFDSARALENAAQQNLELARSVREDVEERRRLGLATRPEFLLARQVEAQAVYDLESARTGVFNARAQLALAMGLPANAPLHVERLFDQPLPAQLDEEVDHLIDAALASRPDLKAQVAQLRASEARVAKAQADFFPVIGLEGSYGGIWWDYSLRGKTINTTQRQQDVYSVYQALVVIEWPLFEGFKRLNRLRNARAEQRQNAARLRELELEATNQVWSVYYNYETAYRKYDYGIALLAASEEAYEATRESYGAGLSTIDELLRAERDLASARYTLIGSRAGLLATSAELAFALGDVTAEGRPTP